MNNLLSKIFLFIVTSVFSTTLNAQAPLKDSTKAIQNNVLKDTAVVGLITPVAQQLALQKFIIKGVDVSVKLEDTLKKQFAKQKIAYPPVAMYIRSFKYDRQLEVWVKPTNKDAFKLFKSYKVCQQSGSMGPKRAEGDFQVPEGFYYINEFNANSKDRKSVV